MYVQVKLNMKTNFLRSLFDSGLTTSSSIPEGQECHKEKKDSGDGGEVTPRPTTDENGTLAGEGERRKKPTPHTSILDRLELHVDHTSGARLADDLRPSDLDLHPFGPNGDEGASTDFGAHLIAAFGWQGCTESFGGVENGLAIRCRSPR